MGAPVPGLRTNLLGLAGFAACAWWLVQHRPDATVSVPLLLAATLLPLILADVGVHRVHLRPSTGLDWFGAHDRDGGRVVTKWIGAAAAIGLVALAYAVYPEYLWTRHLVPPADYNGFYLRYYLFLDRFAPAFLVLGALYLAWIDRYLVDPRDAHWHLGALLLGQRSGVDLAQAADLLRLWLVRGYFLPLLVIYTGDNIGGLYGAVDADRPPFEYWFEVLYSLGLLVDLTFATVGHLLMMRVLDTHPRTVDRRTTAWVTTLLFYQPFLSVFASWYFAYESHTRWGDWLDGTPALKVAWGVAILTCVWTTGLSVVAFGLRFSNLTNRGILTRFTYGWTKHPMYVANVLAIVFVSTPFLYEGDAEETVQRVLRLGVVAGLYWARARAEERHLSRDPEYVRYALAMNERSIFAPLARAFPFLRYVPPADGPAPEPAAAR